jgi:acetyl esterase
MPLDPEIAAYLEARRDDPPRSSLSIGQTRELMRRANALAGPPAALPRVEDFAIHGRIPARQYWPALEPRLPLVVYFHGGRFFSGDLESHDALCRSIALASGRRVLAIDYRLAPEHRFPCAIDDACEAVAWALEQQVAVAVAGDSAGANLAAGAAIAHRRAGLKAQLLVYPMIDATCRSRTYDEFAAGYGPGATDMRRGWQEYLPPGADPRDPRVSPLFATDVTGVAPAQILLAEYDTLRDEGEEYARKLEVCGAPVMCKRYPGTIHGFFAMGGIVGAARRAMDDAAAFLRRRLPES